MMLWCHMETGVCKHETRKVAVLSKWSFVKRITVKWRFTSVNRQITVMWWFTSVKRQFTSVSWQIKVKQWFTSVNQWITVMQQFTSVNWQITVMRQFTSVNWQITVKQQFTSVVYSGLHATFQKKKGVTSTVSSKVMRVTLVNLKLSTLQV